MTGLSRLLSCSALLLFGMALGAPLARAQTIHFVDNVGTCGGQTPCHTAIIDAWNAAAATDTIEVFPGVHPAVSLAGKNDIALKAHQQALKPVIRTDAGSAVTLQGVINVRFADFVIEGTVTVYGSWSIGFEDCRLASIWFSGGGGAVLRGNVVTVGPIRMERPAGDFVVEDNFVQGGGISLGMAEEHIVRGSVRGNVVLAGGITFIGEGLRDNTIEGNFLAGGGINMNGQGIGPLAIDNAIRSNVVLQGGIAIFGGSGSGGGVSRNRIELNAVVSSPAKGISLSVGPSGAGVAANEVFRNFVVSSVDDGIFMNNPGTGSPNVFRQNTSLQNGGCDLNDASAMPTSVWEQNRFGTACGGAEQ